MKTVKQWKATVDLDLFLDIKAGSAQLKPSGHIYPLLAV